jgi:hypothetical protein
MRNILRPLIALALLIVISGLNTGCKSKVTPQQAQGIAQEAYIYGFPMVDNYRIMYSYFVDESSPEFKAPFNQIKNIPRVYTPKDTTIQTPNSDTPYSMAGLDLRAEPVVITVPVIEKGRYFSVQLIDLYTYNFDYIGSRSTGNDGGSYLVAGPDWKGDTPQGISKVFRCETDLAIAAFRTQLFNPEDLPNVEKIQAGYKVQTLSEFTGQPAPPAAPKIDFFKPLSKEEEKTSLDFFSELNFILQFCPVDSSEVTLMEKFAKIDVGGGLTFNPETLSPEMKQAIGDGMKDALKQFEEFLKTEIVTGKVTSGELFGTRAFLKNNYLYRFAAADLGIYGNSKEEAMYPIYRVDASGQPLNGKNKYIFRMSEEQFPPVNAFWSFTMYKLPSSLLVANPIDRYLINSPMLPQLKKNADGTITIYVQNTSPGKDKEANWLPAPDGPFSVFLRLYWPKEAALDGSWKQPPLELVK